MATSPTLTGTVEGNPWMRISTAQVHQRILYQGETMKINVFEGARRIALLVTGVAILGSLAYAVFNKPYAHAAYSVDVILSTMKLIDSCAENDATEYVERVSAEGKAVNIRLCFPAVVWNDGKLAYPFKKVSGEVYGSEDKYGSEARAYYKSVAASFSLTPESVEAFNSNQWKATIAQWKDTAIGLTGGLAFLWTFVVAVGWIVRGFMGIPRGRDSRTAE